jgi:ADP-heptose:LPS heptosyltransferase
MSDDRCDVVVLRDLGLGDLCTAVPALRGLRRHFADHRLVLVAPSWQLPLARLAGVDATVDASRIGSVRRPDVAVNLHGRGPHSTRLLASIEPRRLIAFGRAAPVWRSGEHEVRRWCRLLAESGIAADPADIGLPLPDRSLLPTPLADRAATPRSAAAAMAVIHPGAAAPARRWPAERFAAVAAALVATGHHVALTGNADERLLCDAVASAAGPDAADAITLLAGSTDLMALAATVADADLVVANDTGVAHLASAFAVPSVVLFGPTPPGEWGPPPTGPHRALWAGHRGDPHGERLDPGLAMITADQVLSEIGEVIAHGLAA